MQSENITRINIDLLVPNTSQPRKKFDENSLKELALSIREYGILNPILVRKKDNLYEIIAGERRYRAAKLLELTEVPVIIRNDITDEKMAEIALIENLQRENITAIEEARSYQEILSKSKITEEKLSEMIGKSQSFIANKIRLLNLPDTIQDALVNKKISERHARSLLKVKDTDKQIELLKKIITEKLTVKELDNIINEDTINEKEIKDAISDIMKSLNINYKKEEKESDNMNNESFFPNYNNTNQNNNISLNTMNMQAMNMPGQEVAPVVNSELPTAPIFPNPGVQPVASPVMPEVNNSGPVMMPQNNGIQENQTLQTENNMTQNIEESFVVQPTPNNELNNIAPTTTPTEAVPQTPSSLSSVDIPLFNDQAFSYQPETVGMNNINNQENTQAIPMMSTEPVQPIQQVEATPSIPTVDTPIFDQTATMPNNGAVSQTQVETPTVGNFEMPQPQVIQQVEPIAKDQLSEVKGLLDNNGIEYKLYSNETGHCIIIEL